MVKKLPGIYIHLPFCAVHCVYCDFPLTTRLSLSSRYYEALFKEIRQNPPRGPTDTLYFGGGTPSLTPVTVLTEIVELMPLESAAEITLEANPDHITEEILEAWKKVGINRLSLGIQSLEPHILKIMLREHTPESALEALGSSLSRFQNVNVDLMLGYPDQSSAVFLRDLERLIDLHPQHFSIYLLELHERTALNRMVEQGQLSLMPEEEQMTAFEQSVRVLQKAGYDHYEVSNFALPGKESRHNLKYWNDVPYFAYGAGAAAYLDFTRTKNFPDVSRYIEAMEKEQSPQEEVIHESEETRARNALIFGLRKTKGINVAEFEAFYGVTPEELFRGSMQQFLADGFLELSQNQLRLTEKGLLISNEILSSAL